MHQLLHGHVLTALRFNAFTVLSLPLWAWLGFRFVLRERTGEPATLVRPLWIWIYIGAFVAFGVLRLLPIPLFSSLAP